VRNGGVITWKMPSTPSVAHSAPPFLPLNAIRGRVSVAGGPGAVCSHINTVMCAWLLVFSIVWWLCAAASCVLRRMTPISAPHTTLISQLDYVHLAYPYRSPRDYKLREEEM
jgi:hypothetical protein